jgi:hypothetical protein
MKFSLLIGFVCSALYLSAQVIEKPTEVPQQEVIEQVEPPIEVQVNNVAMEAVGPRPASFPGGTDSLQAYLTTEIEAFIFKDTNEVFPWGEQVFVVFEVGVQGEIINPMIEMGYNAMLDSAALDIVRNMPKWIPATNEVDEPVVSTNRLTLVFDLFLDEEGFEDGEEFVDTKNSAHWAGFEAGIQLNTNAFLSFDPNISSNPEWQNIPLKSTVFNLNLFAHKFRLFSDHFGILTGYGFSFLNTDYKAQYTLQHDSSSVSAVSDNSQNFKRSSLYGAYITMPLMFEFATGNSFKKAFYVNAGVLGGVRIYSHHRHTGTYENGDKFEWITRSKFNLNPFMLDACVRIGYGPYGAFVNYAMMSTFKNGATVGQFPLRFGISLNIPE